MMVVMVMVVISLARVILGNFTRRRLGSPCIVSF
jgi:hypothetical protein